MGVSTVHLYITRRARRYQLPAVRYLNLKKKSMLLKTFESTGKLRLQRKDCSFIETSYFGKKNTIYFPHIYKFITAIIRNYFNSEVDGVDGADGADG